MAQQQYQDTPTIGFRSIQLMKTQTLGIGSYGKVCKAKCDDLLCAAKIIHETLFDPTAQQQIERHREHRLPFSRFQQECEFMSAIKHPNIVQYLGTHQDPETGLPVLLMELMDDSLTHFLESSQDPVPYHIQLNICHDITLAISYLHSNGIIHRDLSSNNVLLRGNVIAKVTDFGMAKLGNANPQATGISLTMVPGTDAYMPPEAVKEPPVYTAKIDCFAIGALTIQILTRQFPKPGNRHKTIQLDHPQFPGGTADVRVSEIERRQNHIGRVDPNHSLLPIALHCLKDSDVERPSAQELCHSVAALKETPQYIESVRSAQERRLEQDSTPKREEQIRELQQQIHQKDSEIHQLRQQHAQQIQGLQRIIGSQNNRLREKDGIIQEKCNVTEERDIENHQLRQQIQKKDGIIQEKQQNIWIREQECLQLRENIRDKDRELQRKTEQLQTNEQVTAQIQKKDDIIQEKQQECLQLRENIRDKDRELQRITQQLQINEQVTARIQKKDGIIQEKKQECLQLRENISDKDRELQRITQQLQTNEQVTAQFQTRIQELEEQLKTKSPTPRVQDYALLSTQVLAKPQPSLRDTPQTYPSNTSSRATTREGFELRWKRVGNAPCGMSRDTNAVVDGNIAYFTLRKTTKVYAFNSTNEMWNQLPDCPTKFASLAVVNNLLTTIGGQRRVNDWTNQLFSLTGKGSYRRWSEVFPPMPTKRAWSTAVCSGQALIVAGGLGQGNTELRTVEIMDIATRQWSTAANLPESLCSASVTVCGDYIYMLGGERRNGDSNSVYTCSLTDLFFLVSQDPKDNVWLN